MKKKNPNALTSNSWFRKQISGLKKVVDQLRAHTALAENLCSVLRESSHLYMYISSSMRIQYDY